MKTLKLIQRPTSGTLLARILVPAVIASALVVSLFSTAHAAGPLTAQLDFGARGTNVTNLQTFLAANPAFYPEGLVTGYFGPLTFAAVKRFQAFYGIAQVGRVGPITLAKINELMMAGGGTGTGDAMGPQFFSVAQTLGQTSDTFTWITNEGATSRVYYSTSPVQFNEGDITSAGFGARTGQIAVSDGTLRTSHQISLTGLLPNTTYYYTLASTDAAGNVSLFGPNNTFRTNP